MQGARQHLRRWLSIYATAIAILAALLTGSLLVQGNGDLTSAEAQFSIGLNLIAAAFYGLIFATLATWVLNRNQRESIEESLEEKSSQLLARISVLDEKYLPEAEYPAAHTFGEPFNRDLMATIERSKSYDFYGPSARYVAARLKKIKHSPQEVRVAMIDPGLDSAIIRRAADREKWASSAGKSLPDIESEFRNELEMTIVSLFDFRTTCPVRIAYTQDTVVYRMELTDDCVFFSWYHGPESAGKEMPESARFGRHSMYYQVLRQEMSRRFEVLPRKVQFDSSQTEAELIRHLHELTQKQFDSQTLDRMRAKYIDYTRDLSIFLDSLGR